MFKRNIKIILVGLFSLILMVLAYGLLGNNSEIISDESLRIEEPAEPSMKADFEIESDDANTPVLMSDSQIKSSLESKLIDRPVANYREDLLANSEASAPAVISEVETPTALTEIESPFRNDAIERFEMNNKRAEGDDSFLSFELKAEAKVTQPQVLDTTTSGEVAQFEQESDVSIIPDQTEFLDLNLTETKTAPEMVLVEGDQLIVDDINQALVSYDLGATEDKESIQEPVAENKASVFTTPEVDEALMQGDSEISKQYRTTMAKLISINAKLRTADEENTQLQRQFEMSVLNNQQLAQIIRDIDNQIKTFTSTN